MSQAQPEELKSFLDVDGSQLEEIEKALNKCLANIKTIRNNRAQGLDSRNQEVELYHTIEVIKSHLKPSVPVNFDANTKFYLTQTEYLLKQTIANGGSITSDIKSRWELILSAWEKWNRNPASYRGSRNDS